MLVLWIIVLAVLGGAVWLLWSLAGDIRDLVAENRQERVTEADLKSSIDTLARAVHDLADMRDALRNEEQVRRFQKESAELAKGGWRGV